MIAAVLHDVVEDTETTLDEIEGRFGPVVRSLVGEVTDDKTMSKLQRKKHRIANARNLSPDAKLIKLADKIDNLTSFFKSPPVGWSEDQIKGYTAWAWHETREYEGTCMQLEYILKITFVALGITEDNAAEWLERYYEMLQKQ